MSDPVLGSLFLLVVCGGVAEAVGLSTGKLLQVSSLSRTKVKSDLILLTASLDFAARRIELAQKSTAIETADMTDFPRRLSNLMPIAMLASVFLLLGALPGFTNDRSKPETIDATAMGTITQMGAVVGITVIIYDYSTPEDRQVLVQAFTKGQNQGLVNALTKMRSVGRISITGTLGYDLSYIRMFPTSTGRKIRFISNRQLRYGEVYWDTQSTAYNLTAGELDLNDTDKSKSTGVLYPAAFLEIDKEGQLQIQLRENPWKLVDLIDWRGTPGLN